MNIPFNQPASTFDEIHTAILKNNGLVYDDHRHGRGEVADRFRQPFAIGQYGDKTVFLCSEDETPYFSLNGMYVDEDGIPHLSRWSVGGVINNSQYGTMRKAIEAYNDPANWNAGYELVPVTNVTRI